MEDLFSAQTLISSNFPTRMMYLLVVYCCVTNDKNSMTHNKNLMNMKDTMRNEKTNLEDYI